MNFVVVVPLLNPGPFAKRLVDAIRMQEVQPVRVVLIDSASTDGSLANFNVLSPLWRSVSRETFDHGGTRNLAFSMVHADAYLFLTQDAIPVGTDAFGALLRTLMSERTMAAAYGRQLPSTDATVFARHARGFNYPPESWVSTAGDIPRRGIRAAFLSNSFAVYRRSAMEEVNFFPTRTLFGEDTQTAARLLQRGWSIGYNGSACVEHSHNYSLHQEFERYFDIGAFHSMTPDFLNTLKSPSGEGRKYLESELRYVLSEDARALPAVVARTAAKWLGYTIGRRHAWLPNRLTRTLSMHSNFWR